MNDKEVVRDLKMFIEEDENDKEVISSLLKEGKGMEQLTSSLTLRSELRSERRRYCGSRDDRSG